MLSVVIIVLTVNMMNVVVMSVVGPNAASMLSNSSEKVKERKVLDTPFHFMISA